MTAIAQEPDQKLAPWLPEKAAKIEKLVPGTIRWADALDLLRSREVEQEVSDLLDEEKTQ